MNASSSKQLRKCMRRSRQEVLLSCGIYHVFEPTNSVDTVHFISSTIRACPLQLRNTPFTSNSTTCFSDVQQSHQPTVGSPSRLSKLPLKLRHKVYDCVLLSSTPTTRGYASDPEPQELPFLDCGTLLKDKLECVSCWLFTMG
jgi:hypothetical protein